MRDAGQAGGAGAAEVAMSSIIERASAGNQCKHLQADLDPYDDWYLYCECGETANEEKCQKGLRNCDFFEGLAL